MVRVLCDDKKDEYRFGFNGQQKTNEIAGIGNHNTALFWEYDTRTAWRWNRDPVVKPWQSPYTTFSGNPIMKIDPNGDDDYYNHAGKWIGSDGQGTAMRVVPERMLTQAAFQKAFAANGLEGIRAMTREIKLPSDADVAKAFSDIRIKSINSGYENKAYFVFDPHNATLGISFQPKHPDDNEHNSINEFDEYGTLDPDGSGIQFDYKRDKFVTDKKLVIVGQIHGHITATNKTNLPGQGKTVRMEGGNGGTSRNDKKTAKKLGVPVHAVDDTEKIQRVDPDGTESTTEYNAQTIRSSFEYQSGKKP